MWTSEFQVATVRGFELHENNQFLTTGMSWRTSQGLSMSFFLTTILQTPPSVHLGEDGVCKQKLYIFR